jgi:thiamine-phosphate pyrophosphorylase
MRPLPRVFAVTDLAICRRTDFAIRAAAIASAGAGIAIVVRTPGATAAEQLAVLDRVRALARPAEASVFGHGDPAVALAAGAQGVQLRRSDLRPDQARRVLGRGQGWIGVSVHQRDEAEQAFAEGADFVVAGSVFASPSHPDRAPRGLDWLAELVALGRPVVAIGGVTAALAPSVRAAGAWGVAAITALWDASDPARAATDLLQAVAP